MNDFNKLVKAQDEYITLLVKEIESMVSIAYTHGWRSDNHEAGVMLREKIAGLKQETAKEEQEGPFPVYDLSHLSEEDKNKFAGEVMKSASESLMATFYSLRLQSHLDQMSINDSNGDKFILAFRKIVDDKLLGPPLPMASSKKEHEGPWKSVVHSSVSDTEAGREYDDHVTITDGRVELYFDGGIDDNDEQLLCNLLNERKIKLDYNHEAEMVADFLEKELKRVNALQREQEGLRWVNLAENPPCVVEDWEDWNGYHVRYASDRVKLDLHLFELRDGALCKIGGTGRLELSEVEWLDESATPSVKEEFTGSVFSQPAPGITLGCISPEARDLLDTIMAAWELHYAGLQKNAPHVEITFYGFAYWLVRWSGLIQPATSALVKEAGQPTEIISREEELIYRIVDQWGNAMCSMDEKVQWLKDYAAESRQQPAGESAVWVKGNYERLYNQIKGGKRTVCYIDHPRFFQQRDICTIKPNNPDMEFTSRGHGYGGINDPGYCGSEIERFIQLCRGLNAEWLDESAGGDQGEAEAVALLEWLLKSGYNPMFAGYYLKGANRATSEELHKLFKEQSKQV